MGGGQRGRTRSRQTPPAGIAYQAASTPDAEAESSVAVTALARAITQLSSSDRPGTTPTYSGRGGRGGRAGKNRWPAKKPYSSDPEKTENRACKSTRPSRDEDICRSCQQTGHWSYDSPNKQKAKTQPQNLPKPPDKETARKDNAVTKKAYVVTDIRRQLKKLGGAVYVRVTINGKVIFALLDSGCEHSLAGSKCLHN